MAAVHHMIGYQTALEEAHVLCAFAATGPCTPWRVASDLVLADESPAAVNNSPTLPMHDALCAVPAGAHSVAHRSSRRTGGARPGGHGPDPASVWPHGAAPCARRRPRLRCRCHARMLRPQGSSAAEGPRSPARRMHIVHKAYCVAHAGTARCWGCAVRWVGCGPKAIATMHAAGLCTGQTWLGESR